MKNWIISVGGYGHFMFEGTAEDAENMRKHKARHEQGAGRKRLADADEIQTGMIKECRNHPNYTNKHKYHCECIECGGAFKENILS